MSQDASPLTLQSCQTSKPIHLLIVEDVPEDAELVVLALENADFDFTHDIAETAASYRNLIQTQTYSAILSDYRLPGFNGLEALELLKQSGQDIPFILITGNLGEEAAVNCIKAGITDYLVKDSLARLPAVLTKALQEFELRQAEKQAKVALRKSEKRFRALIENATDIILILDKKNCLTYVSPSVKRILGYDPETLLEKNFFDFIHPDEKLQITEFLNQVKATPRCCQPLKEFRVLTYHQTWAILEAIAKNLQDDPNVSGIVVNCHDITERYRASEQLRYDAYYDKLTGLANRSTLLKQLKQAIDEKQRRKTDLFALLFLDLDRFKVVNDSLGHLIGDELLQQITNRLKQCHREDDLLARFGGDEFVLLLKHLQNENEAIQVAQRIHQMLNTPFVINEREIYMSTSIGIALSSCHYDQPEQMLRDADTAMYRAKAKGKACHELFDTNMHLVALKEFNLESELRQAMQRQELVVHYQPIFSLQTQQIVGAEALVRWQPPGKSLIPPNDFIPLAEETGLIIALDQWVLQSACTQLRLWQQQFQEQSPQFISVNLSPKQFSQPNLSEQIHRILQETGLEGKYLKLEITESVFMKNSATVLEILSQLQRLEIKICLDDFGTGYSSLSYLHCFPLDSLKIDRSFVSYLGENEKNGVIVRMMAILARELQLELIAEGIESIYQNQLLTALGYRWGQGYWFSPPIDSERLTNLLKNNRKKMRF